MTHTPIQAHTHRTHSRHHGVDVLGVAAVVGQTLAEEEVELGVVGIGPIWYQMSVDEDGLCAVGTNTYQNTNK